MSRIYEATILTKNDQNLFKVTTTQGYFLLPTLTSSNYCTSDNRWT